MENYNRGETDIFRMEIDEYSKVTFLEMVRWTKFLAIIGFIFLGLMVLGMFSMAFAVAAFPGMAGMGGMSNSMAGLGAVGLVLMTLVIIGMTYYPIYGLLRYSTFMKKAMITNNKEFFHKAIVYLKNVFKYYGICMIIVLGFYGVAIIAMLIGALVK